MTNVSVQRFPRNGKFRDPATAVILLPCHTLDLALSPFGIIVGRHKIIDGRSSIAVSALHGYVHSAVLLQAEGIKDCSVKRHGACSPAVKIDLDLECISIILAISRISHRVIRNVKGKVYELRIGRSIHGKALAANLADPGIQIALVKRVRRATAIMPIRKIPIQRQIVTGIQCLGRNAIFVSLLGNLLGDLLGNLLRSHLRGCQIHLKRAENVLGSITCVIQKIDRIVPLGPILGGNADLIRIDVGCAQHVKLLLDLGVGIQLERVVKGAILSVDRIAKHCRVRTNQADITRKRKLLDARIYLNRLTQLTQIHGGRNFIGMPGILDGYLIGQRFQYGSTCRDGRLDRTDFRIILIVYLVRFLIKRRHGLDQLIIKRFKQLCNQAVAHVTRGQKCHTQSS